MARPSSEKLKLLQQMLAKKGIQKQTTRTIPARDPDADPPLSYGQHRMWFVQQLDPESSEYNDTLTVRCTGHAIDVELFGRCIAEIVRRHEVLRTTFEQREGTPYQVVLPDQEIPLRVVDLTDRDAAGQAEALRALWLEEARGPFVLDRPPLIRTTLAKLAADDWEFGLTMHHIVSDGVAYTIFFQELGALYAAFGRGEPTPLPELAVQFGDYAAWERATIDEAVITAKLPFWQRYLGGDLRPIELPMDRQRPATQTARNGSFLRVRFPQALFDAMQNYCRDEEMTSNWVLLAAYFALWHRFSGQKDLVIGTPSSIRGHTELEGLIGFFVQTLILRVDLAGELTFRELIETVRKTALEVSEHEQVPFDRIFQAVRPGQSAADAPLIHAWIAPMKNLLAPLRLPGAESRYEIVDPENARFDIALILDETSTDVTGYWEYDVDLFDRPTVERIDRQFQALLGHVLRHPDTTLGLLAETLREAERGATAGSRKRDARLGGLKKVKRKKR